MCYLLTMVAIVIIWATAYFTPVLNQEPNLKGGQKPNAKDRW